MSEERKAFELRMAKKYPNLYVDMYGDPRRTCMAFGFDVGKGWWPILEELSEKLEPEVVKMKAEMEKDPKTRCAECSVPKYKHGVVNAWRKCWWPIWNIFRFVWWRWRKFLHQKRERSIQNAMLKYLNVYSKRYTRKDLRNFAIMEICRAANGPYNLTHWRGGQPRCFFGFAKWKSCDSFKYPFPRVLQVKEKFSGLRYYMSGETKQMTEWISKAEAKSYKTCERCGQPGSRRSGGWILTLCDECDRKRKEESK